MKNNLKVERAKKDITQAKLAEIIDVSRQTVNAIEKGRYVPSTVLALKMSEYFGVPVNELFTLEENDWTMKTFNEFLYLFNNEWDFK